MNTMNTTEQMRAFSREKAIFRKAAPKNPITGAWARTLNRRVTPAETTPRDRSLRGKARRNARKAGNKLAASKTWA